MRARDIIFGMHIIMNQISFHYKIYAKVLRISGTNNYQCSSNIEAKGNYPFVSMEDNENEVMDVSCPGITSLYIYAKKEDNENEVMDVSCPGITSLYIYAKKKVVDKLQLRIRVTDISGPLNLSEIVALNSTLRELDLSYTNLTGFSYIQNALQDFQQLIKLNLNGNTEFNTSSFVSLGNLPNLNTLNLHGLQLDNKILSKIFLNATPNLVQLDVSSTGLRHLSPGFFDNTPNLKFLDASKNDFHVLKLGNRLVTKLVHLNVSRCKLESLTFESGETQGRLLEVLDVSHNALPALSSGIVDRLAVDAALDVAGNEWECTSCSLYHLWEYLQKRTQVSGGSHIKSCFDLGSLANCGWDECPCGCTCTEVIKTVNCTALGKTIIPAVGPSETQVLILNDNQITSLTNINSSSWCSLWEIQIDQNRLSNFATSELQGSCTCKSDYDEEDCLPQSLTKISAAYNHIRELQTNDCVLLQETMYLNLSHNEIKNMGAHKCGYTIMKELDVSYNRIENIEKRDLASLPYIEKLIVSNNQLSVFYRYPKNLIPHLKYLDLSHNKIKRIGDRLSRNDSKFSKDWEFNPKVPINLVELYLHNNQFGDSGGFIQVTNISKKLQKLTLHDNPWVCDCQSDTIVNHVYAILELDFTLINAIKSMICQRPSKTLVIDFLKNCSKQLEIPQLEKESPTHETDADTNEMKKSLTYLIVTVVLVLVLLGLFMWLCRFCACVTKTLNGGQTMAELADETQGRKYDVFIVHAGADRDFVKEHVILPLVNKGYQVAWHEIMFTPGNYIYENIEKAVKNSRRMLVVATEEFSKSHWGIKEIRRGRHEEVDIHGYKITALVTNSLPRELKPELYEIVQQRTHVVFSDRDYIEKICDFLPRPDPRMLSSLNTTISDIRFNTFVREFLSRQDSVESDETSHPTVYQVFHTGIENGHITLNTEVEHGTTDESPGVASMIAVNKSRFKVLPVKEPPKTYRSSFRRKLSEASSIVTFPSYICLPSELENEGPYLIFNRK
ncbi:unnamed protein product, partial [Meganyctiphanes norvegica]